jgi:hypothetical protein
MNRDKIRRSRRSKNRLNRNEMRRAAILKFRRAHAEFRKKHGSFGKPFTKSRAVYVRAS